LSGICKTLLAVALDSPSWPILLEEATPAVEEFVTDDKTFCADAITEVKTPVSLSLCTITCEKKIKKASGICSLRSTPNKLLCSSKMGLEKESFGWKIWAVKHTMGA
jgi:hypothetical protein